MRRRTTLAALSALLLSCLGACHGRPLQRQLAHLRPDAIAPADDARASTDGPTDPRVTLESRLAEESPYLAIDAATPDETMARVYEAVHSRDPRRSRPRRPVGHVRGAVDRTLANAAQPSWTDPAKAHRPGEAGLDVLAAAAFVKCLDLLRARKR